MVPAPNNDGVVSFPFASGHFDFWILQTQVKWCEVLLQRNVRIRKERAKLTAQAIFIFCKWEPQRRIPASRPFEALNHESLRFFVSRLLAATALDAQNPEKPGQRPHVVVVA
jgi:hypothetical protein